MAIRIALVLIAISVTGVGVLPAQAVVTDTASARHQRESDPSTATITAAELLSKSQAPDLATLLNARVPGVTVVPSTGRLGAGPQITIRGVSSLNLDNNPLIYIDGIRVSNAVGTGPTSLANGGLGSQNAGVAGRLNDITPEQIDRIEILRGPEATTIYGTGAANGVIRIVTKKGSGSRPHLNLSIQGGAIYFRDAKGRVPTNFLRDSNGDLVAFNGVASEKARGTPLFTTGQARQYNAALSGGLGVAGYYLAGNYQNDSGVEPNNSNRQTTGHANLTLMPSSKFDVGTSLNYVQSTAHLGEDVGVSALLGADLGHPLLFTTPGARGFYPGIPPEVPQTLWDNSNDVNRFTGSVTMHNASTGWFNQRVVVGLDRTREDGTALEKFAPPELAPYTLGSAAGRVGQTLTTTTVVTADYTGTARVALTRSLTSSSTIGGQFYRTGVDQDFQGGIGFPGPDASAVAATITKLASTQFNGTNKTIGGYVQEELGLRERLFLTGALRVDNNNAFGGPSSVITYPKVSALWVISKEPFWHAGFVNTLRVRAAYGESGRLPAVFGTANEPFTGSFGNPNLKPERGREIELGFESELFNRLDLEFTYYTKHTTDEIVVQPTYVIPGPPSGYQRYNAGQVNNHGLELQARLQVLRGDNFEWDIAGNVATAHNRIMSQGDLPSLTPAAGQFNIVGFPIGAYFARRVVSATQDPTTGAVSNVLCDGGVGQAPVDCRSAPAVYIGTSTPTNTGSIANTLTLFKRLRFYALVDWKHGQRLENTAEYARCSGVIGVGLCDVNYHPSSYSPAYVAETNAVTLFNNYTPDQFIEDASFVKLREVSATYTLPGHLIPGFDAASITVAGRELGVWTNYRGPDPEVNALPTGVGAYDQAVTPPLSRVTATLNLAF